MPQLMPRTWLLPGQGMSSDEFLERWERMPELKRAELLEGIVYMASPVRIEHGSADGLVSRWLGRYADATPGLRLLPATTCVFGERNVPQPDQSLIVRPEYGGQTKIVDGYLTGAPELAVEVSYSSADYDQTIKKSIYAAAGVVEYVVFDLLAQKVTWWRLVDNGYRKILRGPDGVRRSHVFPGLWLDERAFWSEDNERMMKVAAQGLASPEHADFRKKLTKRR
ncbi:MAG: Uma2 family endonuclease [Bryobacteraceae bacterium]|nr:Uma2 family endonuclease [Bryobacteraceae bacterium]